MAPRLTGPLDRAPATSSTSDGLGIEFYRSRRRKLSLREMVLRRENTSSKETFWALKDISFSVGPGEAVGLVGSNGGGKSTLLKAIAGVLLPDEGRVDGVAEGWPRSSSSRAASSAS